MTHAAFNPTLCLVVGPDDTLGRDPVAVTEAALAGGVTLVQLRWKHAPADELIALARRLARVTARRGVPLLLNDRADLATVAGAQGAHVGQGDMDARAARACLGPSAILGLSIERPDQLAAIEPKLIDYVGVGPIFETATKPDHAAPLGVEGLAALRPLAPVPVLAIGGVDAAHASTLRRAGADGLAVVSAICRAPDPEQAARTLRRAFASA